MTSSSSQETAPRSYAIRTYGCQMNEHDSERIAGLLEADGLVLAESDETADVMVFNTKNFDIFEKPISSNEFEIFTESFS